MRIETRVSERVKKIHPSSTLAITSKAKKLKSEGKDVINFAAGEPDFDTPDAIKEKAIEAIKSGFTKYTPTTGIPELKQLICAKFKTNSLDYEPNQIVVSSGAKHSIFNAMLALINAGDEVLIPSPFWVSYPEMVRVCEGIPRFIKTTAENNFKLSPQELQAHISQKTKLLVLNSPSNPTGSVYLKEELQELAALCVSKKIFVLSDEIYENLIYEGLTHVSIGSLGKEIYNLTVTVNGLSKSFSMTGWRIGYLGAPVDIIEAISKLQDHSTSNPCSISQKAAVAALGMSDEFTKFMAEEFQKRRDYIANRLQAIKKIRFVMPQGAFYVFCDISRTKLSSAVFASRLLDEALVALIPGDAFGRDDYVRISFATGLKQIESGMNRIEEWVKCL
ncbi:MAG: pyridoxal phosphate-dependent aminotransferase [Candidatus Omnitrophota bacterium]|nr:MAG: pyridoxal phosphate-dependent aminotransferase [Candidatus Omnitrophota bacterium]